jgi:hypothetical protein
MVLMGVEVIVPTKHSLDFFFMSSISEACTDTISCIIMRYPNDDHEAY